MFLANVLVFVGFALATTVFLPVKPALTLAGFTAFGGAALFLVVMNRVEGRTRWTPDVTEAPAHRVHTPPPAAVGTPRASERFIRL